MHRLRFWVKDQDKTSKFRGLREKLYLFIVVVILIFGLVSSLIGTIFIQSMTLQEAQTRVGNNLQSAWSVMDSELNRLEHTMSWLGRKDDVITALKNKDISRLKVTLKQIKDDSQLDFLTLTDHNGVSVLRTSCNNRVGEDNSAEVYVRAALAKQAMSGMLLFSPERMDLECEHLSEKAFILFKPTPHAKPLDRKKETRGMVMVASSPIMDDARNLVGTVYGGILLNRNYPLVDKIRSVVFGNELYDGEMVGTVTIFQWDTRIATNVTDLRGLRAIGTRVSEEVYDQTLENGLSWNGRAFVVKDWYISAYDPIKDIRGEIIGMLYVGALEKKYADMKTKLFLVFNALSFLWILIILAFSTQVARKVITPIHNLAVAARQISTGSFDIDTPEVRGNDEVSELTSAFQNMVEAIQVREEEIIRTNVRLTSTNQAYMEMLSFISHELKNQIAGSAMAVRTLQRDSASVLADDSKQLLNKLGDSMNYLGEILQNYMDLSRLESGDYTLSEKKVNFLAEVVIPSLERLSMFMEKKEIKIRNQNDSTITLVSDPTFLNIIYYNLLHNAVKFGKKGGVIRLSSKEREGQFQFEVWNEGECLSREMHDKIFEKFFRGEQSGKIHLTGTGLGLYITKNLVEMLGGKIWVESEVGKWVSYYVTLPRK